MSTPTSASVPAAKPHYDILDGLRGVAAVTVVIFHLFEAHAGGDPFKQVLNHGYLAVDFFFLLSGFVLGYAYDDRWGRMGYLDFLRRRLIRLQPMVVMGALIGAAFFYVGASKLFPGIASVPGWKLAVVTTAGMALLPLTRGWDIRGWDEMYPTNGPAWSLFFEYIANIAYALVLRRVSRAVLTLLTLAASVVTFHYLFTTKDADMIGGWALNAGQLRVGLTRLAYPFLAGLLLYRVGWRVRVRHGFWVCSAVLFALLAVPRLGDRALLWPNALYEGLCITVLFPLVVAAGAGSELLGERSHRVCNFLGRLSYPIYITHYPLIYLYTAWLVERQPTPLQALPVAAGTLALIVAIGYITLRFYDEPVRARLTRRTATQ